MPRYFTFGRFALVVTIVAGASTLLAAAAPAPPAGGADTPAPDLQAQVAAWANATASLPAGVTAGPPLIWRTLHTLPADKAGPYNGLFTGHFAAGADQQLLLAGGELAVVNLDGTVQPLNLPAYPHSRAGGGNPSVFAVWDYNGDGVDDLISPQYELQAAEEAQQSTGGLTDHMAAYGLDGRFLGQLGGHEMGPQIVAGRLDGSGRTNLLMAQAGDYADTKTEGVRGFGASGQVVFSAGHDWDTPYMIAGDVDGDGRDVLIKSDGRGLDCIGLDKPARQLASLTVAGDGFSAGAEWCQDIDGDGRGELFAGDGTVFNTATGRSFQLALPPGYSALSLDGMFNHNIDLATLDGQRRIAALLPGPQSGVGETLALWSTDGKLVYAENLGERAICLRVAHAGGKDHLALLTTQRLLVTP
jgi:hypothetical protein